MVEKRKSILDAVSKLISSTLKDGKGPLATHLYALQKEQKIEQALQWNSLDSTVSMIVSALYAQNQLDQVKAWTKDTEKIEAHTIGRQVDSVAHGDVVVFDIGYKSGNLHMYRGEVLLGDDQHDKVVYNKNRQFFLVVGAGGGRVAFFNPSRNRFLAVLDQKLVPSPLVTNLHDFPRGGESLELNNKEGMFSLTCPTESGYLVKKYTGRESHEIVCQDDEWFGWKIFKFNS